MSDPRAHVRVDLSAIAYNWAEVDRLAQPGRSAAVVKAGAYGLGAVPVARALVAVGCAQLFVATANEAVELRDAGIDATLFVLEGALPWSDDVLAAHGAVPVLNDAAQCARWLRRCAHAGRALPCAVHVDTGMSRTGFALAEFERTVPEAVAERGLDVRLLMTHLACADEPEHEANARQLAAFARARARLPRVPTSIGNSAAALAGAAMRGDLVRPGIALFGGNPFVDRRAVPLRDAVRVVAPIVQVRTLAAGDSVGYGARFRADRAMRVATLGIGYADGYPRALGDAGWGVLRGARVAVLGRVSMDFVVIDVSHVAGDVEVGEAVTLIGPGVTLDDVADAAGTIGYELLTRLGPRLRRHYVGGSLPHDA